MNGTDYTATIDELSASEGVFTTAQAERLGVPRNVLAKASDSNKLVRVVHGAYRSAAYPSSQTDEATAAWKLTNPSKMTHERMRPADWDGVTVGGTSAASIRGIGDFYLSPYRILAPKRVNTRNKEVRFGVRSVDRDDVSFEYGFPVTKIERTLVDLILDGEDPSLIRDAYKDALKLGLDRIHLDNLISRECKGKKAVIASIVFREDNGDV